MPRQVKTPRRPRPLDLGNPTAVVRAVSVFVRTKAAALPPGQCLTLSVNDVRAALGMAVTPWGKYCRSYSPIEQLFKATLLMSGFQPGTRGKSEVFRRVSSDPHPASSDGPYLDDQSAQGVQMVSDMGRREAGSVDADAHPTAAQPAQLATGPHRANTAQRRLAAEKCVRLADRTR